ncbi:unnamed protein product, partial [Discosporangium mesarthrocarpum]
WVHSSCAAWQGIPLGPDGVYKVRAHVKRLEEEQGASEEAKAKPRACSSCGGDWGGLIPCSRCPAMFHPLCGDRDGGVLRRGHQVPPEKWKGVCPKHTAGRAVDRLCLGGGDEEIQRLRRMAVKLEMVAKASIDHGLWITCHCCKVKKAWTVDCTVCQGHWCANCIARHRGTPEEIQAKINNASPIWECFKCQHTCTCAACRKRRPPRHPAPNTNTNICSTSSSESKESLGERSSEPQALGNGDQREERTGRADRERFKVTSEPKRKEKSKGTYEPRGREKSKKIYEPRGRERFKVTLESRARERSMETPEPRGREKSKETSEPRGRERFKGTPESRGREKPNGTSQHTGREKPKETLEPRGRERFSGTPEPRGRDRSKGIVGIGGRERSRGTPINTCIA